MKTKEQRLRGLIQATHGRFFRIDFVNADYKYRRMIARVGVRKNLTGEGLSYDPLKRKIRIVYDVQKRAYRAVRLDRVVRIKCGQLRYTDKQGWMLKVKDRLPEKDEARP